MYNLPYFKADDEKDVIEFMHQHSFIALCGSDSDCKPVATHIPVLIEQREEKLFLVGHIMKQTDHHKAFAQNKNVLAIFSGPHAYVSASWYIDKQQASTWNYTTVHAKGELAFLDENALLEVLTKTTAKFENNNNSPSLVEHLSTEYVQRLMKAIIAFEIEVTAIDHVFKLSQNRDKESYHNIIDKLHEGDNNSKQMADLMQKRMQ